MHDNDVFNVSEAGGKSSVFPQDQLMMCGSALLEDFSHGPRDLQMCLYLRNAHFLFIRIYGPEIRLMTLLTAKWYYKS